MDNAELVPMYCNTDIAITIAATKSSTRLYFNFMNKLYYETLHMYFIAFCHITI